LDGDEEPHREPAGGPSEWEYVKTMLLGFLAERPFRVRRIGQDFKVPNACRP
jgi:hypothetical protein